jgi:GntR family transcriptional regulator
VGVLSVAAVQPAPVHEAIRVLLVECSPSELDFFAGELEGHLPLQVDKVLLEDLATIVRRRKEAAHWRAAVTSFCHLAQVERLLKGTAIPPIALVAEVHVETLRQLAHYPGGTRVGVVSAAAETAHNLEHSIANAGLPNLVLAGVCLAESPALGRLVRRVDVIVCSTPAAARVRAVAGPTMHMILDDRALGRRAVEMLADLLVRQDGDQVAAAPPTT